MSTTERGPDPAPEPAEGERDTAPDPPPPSSPPGGDSLAGYPRPAPAQAAPPPPPTGAPPTQGAPPPGALPPPQGAPYSQAPVPAPDPANARNMAMLAHLSALIGLIGLPSIIGPLIVWLTQREQDPYVDAQGKEAVNFNLSFLIYILAGFLVGGVLAVITFGLALFLLIPLLIAASVAWLVFVVIAGVRASRGEPYRYPLTIRLIA